MTRAESPTALRRRLVTISVALALLGAGATIRAAALWASQSATLNVAPASMTSIESALAQEQARSAALQGQLDSLRGASQDLASALAAAESRVGTDQTTADTLRASLTAAQTKLTSLEAALKAAAASAASRTRTTRPSTTTTTTTTAPGGEVGDD